MLVTPIEVVANWLRPQLSCPVVSKVPAKRPDLFVRVDSGAPNQDTLISTQTLMIIQVYGTDLEQVLHTIDQAQEAMALIDLKDAVLGWEPQTREVEFPDPDLVDWHRWQFTGWLNFEY